MRQDHKPWPEFERLDCLFEREGMARSPEVWFNIHAILSSKIADNRDLSSPAALARILGPLVCKNPEHQQRIESVMTEWLTGKAPEKAGITSNSTPTDDKPRKQQRNKFKIIFAVSAFALLCLLGLGINHLLTHGDVISPPPRPIIDNPNDKPPIPIQDPQKPVTITDSVKPNPLPLPVAAEPSPLIYGLTVLGLPLLLLALFLVWRYLPQWVLRNEQETDDASIITNLEIKDFQNDPDLPFASVKTASDLSPLIKPTWLETQELHIEDTVLNTANYYGLFSPVYRVRSEHPEYLILLQTLHGYDQIAEIAQLFIQAMQRHSHHIRIRGYRFQDDPRWLNPIVSIQPKDNPDKSNLSLEQLATYHRDARVIVISDWDIAFQPYQHDQPQKWIDNLKAFEKRIWLCPGYDSWYWAEQAKTQAKQLDIKLLPLSSNNVQDIVQWLSQEHQPQAPLGVTQIDAYPALLTETSESWLSRRPPHGVQLKRLLWELHRFLGEQGLLILQALAMFPKPVWPLPYILDAQLFPDIAPRPKKSRWPWRRPANANPASILSKEQRLINIGRLPWSRNAYMPDYLRELLINALTKPERKKIQQAWKDIIARFAINPRSAKAESIPIAASSLSQMEIEDFLNRQAPGNGLDDAIFANMMIGGKLGLLDFKLPQLFNNLLPNAAKVLDLRPAMKAAVLAGLSIWGMHYTWQTVGKQWLLDYQLKTANQINAEWQIELTSWRDNRQPNDKDRQQLAQAMQIALGALKFKSIQETDSTKPQDFTDFGQNSIRYAPGGLDQALRVQQTLAWTSYGAQAELEPDSRLPPKHITVRLVQTYQHGSAFNDELRYAYQKPEQSIGPAAESRGALSEAGLSNDPLEGWNRKVQSFNEALDAYAFKPLAKAYRRLLPNFADQGVSNFYSNLDDISVALNALLQFKYKQSGSDALRWLVNSTAGIGGLVDQAERFDLPKHNEDFDQTLAVWGVPSGPYLVLPVLGPSSVRGVFGFLGDAAIFLLPWLILLTWRQVAPFKTVVFIASLLLLNFIDKRADNLSADSIVDAAALDKYEFTKNAYLQLRQYLANDGNVSAGDSVQLAENTTPFQEPVMIRIKPGAFQMGSGAGESGRDDNESPQHRVSIGYAFEIGQTEITVDQYAAFAQATGRKIPDDNGWAGDNLPVTHVSFNDAQAYARWLSQQTGKQYRLPTEAEWEYAARAGTDTAYWWGDSIGNNNAVCYRCGSQWDAKQAAPVASLKANRFGLYDTAGNVWEWTADCYHNDYNKAPRDGSAWLEADGGDCDRRVVRGGSWYLDPQILRSASRNGFLTDDTYSYLGFRIARAL